MMKTIRLVIRKLQCEFIKWELQQKTFKFNIDNMINVSKAIEKTNEHYAIEKTNEHYALRSDTIVQSALLNLAI